MSVKWTGKSYCHKPQEECATIAIKAQCPVRNVAMQQRTLKLVSRNFFLQGESKLNMSNFNWIWRESNFEPHPTSWDPQSTLERQLMVSCWAQHSEQPRLSKVWKLVEFHRGREIDGETKHGQRDD